MFKTSCRPTFEMLGLTLMLGAVSLGSVSVLAGDGEISHQARALQPGEVILVSIRSEDDLGTATLEAFDRKFPLFKSDDGDEWQALVGIDLSTKPGTHTLRVSAPDLENAYRPHRVRVKGKTFPTRRLKVDEKFVTPPQQALERIRLESRRVSAIFSNRSPQRYWSGTFQRPVPGRANSSFGKRSILNGKPRSPHTGTDFTADTGTPIAAPNAGRVVLAEDLYYSGNTVIIDHGLGLYSYFAHLSEFLVWEGDMVTPRTILGKVGATGRVTGPHLHWTMKLAGTSVDPLSLMAVLAEDLEKRESTSSSSQGFDN